MKNIFLFIIFLSSSLLIKAQDTIIKRNGEKLIVKLTEVNPDNVRYKRIDNPDGPLFMLPKDDIKYIVYANGTKDSFENYTPPPVINRSYVPLDLTMQISGKRYYYKERRISEPDMLAVASKLNDPKINLMIKTVEQKHFIQRVTMFSSIGLGVAGTYEYLSNAPRRRGPKGGGSTLQTTTQAEHQKYGEYMMLASIACEAASIYFTFDRRRNAHIVVEAYNKAITIR